MNSTTIQNSILMKRFITLGEKVYDRGLMSNLNITDAMLRYLPLRDMYLSKHPEILPE